jgi:hypothetical protein
MIFYDLSSKRAFSQTFILILYLLTEGSITKHIM